MPDTQELGVPSNALQGLSVLITRPEGQGDSLVELLNSQGASVVHVPLMRIEAVTDPNIVARARQRVANLDQYEAAIFISSNAARFGLDLIDQFWPQFPVDVEVVAIGPTTAAMLSELSVPILTPASGSQSEDLLDMPAFQNVSGSRIAIFRGVGGRELLAQSLEERGARVDYIECYCRAETSVGSAELLTTVKERSVDAVVVTSGQILEMLNRLVDIKEHGWNLLPVVVPSIRVRDLALKAGFEHVIVSEGATDASILKALAELN